MKTINISLIAFATLFFASCGSNETNQDQSEPASAPVEKSTAKVCTFSYDASTTKLTWTAFKTSAKVAVGGTFDNFAVENTVDSKSESAVFENATFTIETATVNSGNETRDPKLVEFFFDQMVDPMTIEGGIDKISEAVDGKGAAIINITMNGETKQENATYTLEGTVLTLSATLDLSKWAAENAVASLNKACEVLHTGDDGVSQLWSEVEVEITTTLAKSCE
ncbi:YceI family protein [bacterium SCSIO 12643]|nr:YceI family protein [bacterium SCSIO 12643]